MARTLLQEMVEATRYESLPANWSTFDLRSFSREKHLWDYQQEAVAYAVVALWKYHEEFGDYQRGESQAADLERKRMFFGWYQQNGLLSGLNLPLKSLGRYLTSTLTRPTLSYSHLQLRFPHRVVRVLPWPRFAAAGLS